MGSSSFQFAESSETSLDINNKENPVTDIEKISFEPNLYYKIINKITQGVNFIIAYIIIHINLI